MHVEQRKLRDNLVIRGAVREDAHAIARILREGADDGLVARVDEVDPGAVSRQIEFARAMSNALYVVAAVPIDDDDEVIGLLLLEGQPLLRLHDVARLTMAVAREHRNKGIGRAMMRYALECADQSGQIRKIELLTRANNETAIHLYSSLGFAEEGRLRARLRLEDGSYLDDVCMSRFKPQSPPES